MNCERCGQREAVLNYTEIEEGVKRRMWLCEVCAAEEGVHLPGQEPAAEGKGLAGGLEVFLGNLVTGAGGEAADAVQPACATCGHTLQKFLDSGLLGCPECYGVFREHLLPVLRRYHRSTTHLGKAPRARGPRAALRLEIARLRNGLDQAVACEDYEEAARLRDRIRTHETELSRQEPAPEADAAGAGDDEDTGGEKG